MGRVSSPQSPLFGSVADVAERLAGVGYLASTAVATTVYLADRLGKPLLVEGPAGVGKTELAKAVAEATSSAEKPRTAPAPLPSNPLRAS